MPSKPFLLWSPDKAPLWQILSWELSWELVAANWLLMLLIPGNRSLDGEDLNWRGQSCLLCFPSPFSCTVVLAHLWRIFLLLSAHEAMSQNRVYMSPRTYTLLANSRTCANRMLHFYVVQYKSFALHVYTYNVGKNAEKKLLANAL